MRKTGEIEQRLDQVAHIPGSGNNLAEETAEFIPIIPALIGQNLGVAADHGERFAQIVGDGVVERLEFAVGVGQFQCPLLKLGVEPSDPLFLGLVSGDVVNHADLTDDLPLAVTKMFTLFVDVADLAVIQADDPVFDLVTILSFV